MTILLSHDRQPEIQSRAIDLPQSESERRKFQRAMVARASDFSLPALMALLSAMGYGEETVEFRSNLTTLHQPSLIASIEFAESQQVVVTLNIGLLASQSPLPNYVFQYMEAQTRTALLDFFGFCAHHLLRQVAKGQRWHSANQEQRESARQVLCLLGRKSTSTLHWVVSQAFPELTVHVAPGQKQVAVRSPTIRLGMTTFGDGSSFGGCSSVRLPRISVTLLAQESRCRTGEHWHSEATRRLASWVLPRLLDQELYLSVVLILCDAESWLELGRPRQLGVEPFRVPATWKLASTRRIPIFAGEVTRASLAALTAASSATEGKS